MELTNKEMLDLDASWYFLGIFSKPDGKLETYNDIVWYKRDGEIFGVKEYRHYIIDRINFCFTIKEFYKYEKIMNKLYWNLKTLLKDYVKDNQTKYKIWNKSEWNRIGKEYKSSTINSYIQYNENNDKIYTMNDLSMLDKICMNLMLDKNEYRKYSKNPEKIGEYNKFIDFYYYMNYPFPNMNPMFFNENSKKYKLKKIKKMYYSKDDSNWYNLIKN